MKILDRAAMLAVLCLVVAGGFLIYNTSTQEAHAAAPGATLGEVTTREMAMGAGAALVAAEAAPGLANSLGNIANPHVTCGQAPTRIVPDAGALPYSSIYCEATDAGSSVITAVYYGGPLAQAGDVCLSNNPATCKLDRFSLDAKGLFCTTSSPVDAGGVLDGGWTDGGTAVLVCVTGQQ